MFRRGESAPILAVILVIAIDGDFLVPSEILQSRTVGEPVDLVQVHVHNEDSILTSVYRVSDCRSPAELCRHRILLMFGDDEESTDHECEDECPDEHFDAKPLCLLFFCHRDSPLSKERTLVTSIPKKVIKCQVFLNFQISRPTNWLSRE